MSSNIIPLGGGLSLKKNNGYSLSNMVFFRFNIRLETIKLEERGQLEYHYFQRLRRTSYK